MKLKMHDELISMDISQKMLELSAIDFSPMNPSISMKRKFSSNSHFRPHLTSASSDISNEEQQHMDECEDEDDDSRASSTLVGNGDLKNNSKISNGINLPSPPSSTRSSFDGITRDSFLSNGDVSENNEDSHVSTFGSISLSNDIFEELPENDYCHDKIDDDIKLLTQCLVDKVVEVLESSNTQFDDNEELWKDIEIDLDGETLLPNGLNIIRGVADMPFYRENDSENPIFTNQLNFLKTILTKYICRYKTAMPFLHPVDSVRLKIPHYYLVIRQPMDLNTVKNRLNFLWYRSAKECISDIRLIFSNCYQFNAPTDYVYSAGKKLEEYIDDKLKDMPPNEVEIPCPPRPSIEEFQKVNEKRNAKKRTGSISESSENGENITGVTAFTPIKMTTRSERGVMVRKPSKDLPAPISTPQIRIPSVKKVPLNAPMKFCYDFVKELFTKKHAEYAWPFWEPVNVHDYPDYLEKVKRPIDLSSIKCNIETGKYVTVNDFAKDMRLMFSNCLRYNTPESPIIEQARKLREAFEFKYARIPEEWLQQKLVIPKSRTTSPSVRNNSASTSLVNHTMKNSDVSKVKKGKSQQIESKRNSQKMYNSLNDSGHISNSLRLSGASADNEDSSSESRMKMLEMQVERLTNALTSALMGSDTESTRTALINAMVNNTSTPYSKAGRNGTPNGGIRVSKRGKKNGYEKGGKKPVNSKKQNSRKRKHLSSDEEDSDVDTSNFNDLSEPFDPEKIEDLKKLKDDLENLHAKDLQNVLRILQSTEPSLRCDDESNVEIDFEALKPKTLVALRKYVTSCMLNTKASPSSHSASANNFTPTTGNNSKKFCHASNSLRSSSNIDTDCDNSTINVWSRAGSRASNLQLSESSSSDSEMDD